MGLCNRIMESWNETQETWNGIRELVSGIRKSQNALGWKGPQRSSHSHCLIQPGDRGLMERDHGMMEWAGWQGNGGSTRAKPRIPFQVFGKVAAERRGKVQVFFCGSAGLAKVIHGHCRSFGFRFSKENF